MLRLRDIMTTDVVAVGPEMTLREAMQLLVHHGISGAPVVEHGEVLGVVSASDLLLFASVTGEPRDATVEVEPHGGVSWHDGGEAPGEEPAGRDPLRLHRVREVMTRAVLTLPPSALVRHAADYMRQARVHRILVVDHGRVAGIVTTLDVARAVAEGRLTTRTYVFGAPAGR